VHRIGAKILNAILLSSSKFKCEIGSATSHQYWPAQANFDKIPNFKEVFDNFFVSGGRVECKWVVAFPISILFNRHRNLFMVLILLS